jgi:F-type H+-transporting ATPase subunit alpha
VSRVGGSAQVKGMRKVAGRLRLDLAQYRELEAFAAFGSDLDAASKAQLARGARLVELLKQPQYSPFSVEDEIISIWTGTTGKLDDVPVEDVRRFEREFLDYLHREQKGLVDAIAETKDLSDDIVQKLEEAVDSFKKQFETSEGKLLVNEEPVEAMEKDEVEQEKITRHVRKPADKR